MQKYHFISGLPRSGSTLLTSILNQNPRFYSTISNPLARFVRSIIIESEASSGYNIQCPVEKRLELIQQIIKTYHSHIPQEVCFNTNRGWTTMLPLIEQAVPGAKIICCVRDIRWILDSFERLFRNNPFVVSKIYAEHEAESVYSRAYSLMTAGHTLRFAYDALKEAITGPQKSNVFILEYDLLTKNPEIVMKSLYNFIDEPYFEHDFNNLDYSFNEFDNEVGVSGLHNILPKVQYIDRTPILPPDLWEEFKGLEVWR